MKTITFGGMLVLLFAVFLLLPESGLDEREAVSAWVVRDDTAISGTPREMGRAVRANLNQLQNRIEEQPETPFYSLVLDAWVMVVGESVVAMRYLSALLVTVGVVVLSRIQRTPIIILPIATMVFIYPAVTVDAYGLLLLLTVISTYLLMAIIKAGTIYRAPTSQEVVGMAYMPSVLYILTLLLTIATHGSAIVLIVVHVAIVIIGSDLRYLPLRYIGAAWGLSSVVWLILALPIPDFEVGVLVILLPFLAAFLSKLVVYGETNQRQILVVLGVTGTLAAGILSAWIVLSRPNWPERIDLLNRGRRSDEPMLISYSPKSALAHYDRQENTRIRTYITVDVGWREFPYDELASIVDKMADATSIWVLMHKDDPVTWDVMDIVAAERIPTYRIEESGMLIYRFDRQEHDPRFEND